MEVRIVRSIALSVAMRWTDRVIGIVSTIVLARLLAPEDFGVIAQASLVIGMIDVLLDLGVAMALIQNREPTVEHYNTAWTMRLLQCLLASIGIVAIAPFASKYFGEPGLFAVLLALSVGVAVSGLENIGVVTFQKEMRFGLDFKLAFIKRISGFVVTIVAAALYRSYWALVAGMLTSRCVGVTLSYVMHPMRPRLSISRFRDIFGFSQWALVRGVGSYLNNELDRLIVGGRSSTETMGAYSLANEVAAMPASEFLAPVNRALFPALVLAKESTRELVGMFMLAQSAQSMLAIPASIGLVLIAPELVAVLFGEKWMIAVPFLQILALAYLIHGIMTTAGYVIITLGRIRWIAVLAWAQVLVFFVAAIFVMPAASAKELSWLRVFTVACGAIVAIWMLKRVLKELSIVDVLRELRRPVIATCLMAAIVIKVDAVLALPDLLAVVVKVFLGGSVYLVSIYMLWWIAGRPRGAEAYMIERVRSLGRGK